MSYTYETLLKPLRENDKILRIYDETNVIKYNINPFSVQRLFVVESNLNISLTGNRNIIIDFENSNDAKQSLVQIQNYIDILKNRTTPVVDKGIEQYVTQSAGFIKSINGSSASVQTLSIQNGSNINGQISRTGGAHLITLELTGIIPIEKGGLGNQTFTQNEILIAGTNSVQSSGYRIDDGGENDKTLWTAERIKQQVLEVSPFKRINTLSKQFSIISCSTRFCLTKCLTNWSLIIIYSKAKL